MIFDIFEIIPFFMAIPMIVAFIMPAIIVLIIVTSIKAARRNRIQNNQAQNNGNQVLNKSEVTTNYNCSNCGDKIQKRIYTNAFGRTVRVEYYCESCGVTFEERELDAFLKKNHNVDANNL